MNKTRLLFLCTGNSCRSQMAEGLVRARHPDRFEVHSAGIEKHGLNPDAVAVMAEIGIDISSHTSRRLDELEDPKFDLVITVCGHAHETCPLFPGDAEVIHQGFDDPPTLARGETDRDKVLGHYRRVRDEIDQYVRLLPEIVSTPKS